MANDQAISMTLVMERVIRRRILASREGFSDLQDPRITEELKLDCDQAEMELRNEMRRNAKIS